MPFSPIAIVGRACVLPGALSPEALWSVVSEGRDLVRSAPRGRWRLAPEDVRCTPDDEASDRTWSDRGGYVEGFDTVWDPTGFGVQPELLDELDPLFHWVLHCAREALRDAGDERRGVVARPRVGAVFGNLGFPSATMARYAEAVWQEQAPPHPLNRFMASGAADVLERALGLSPGVFCLDTACASSLYAIRQACDRLHDGQVDLALAGAVNASDDLFLHVGFTALGAMSRSGRTRPFHARADGLLPAEGAGFVALKRLADARRDGDRIHGILRGIGLSNDGRGRGFLAPSESGQRRALEQAYADSGVRPRDVSLLECHATGTAVGDAAEIRSTGATFSDCRDVPIGSLKSNLGHLVTAAGVAGLIKVLEAFRHRRRPPTLHADVPNPALTDSPFRLLHSAEPWECEGPRVAGVSAFGFGGNNAHLVVSENDDSLEPLPITAPRRTPMAIVGVGTVVGDHQDRPTFTRALRTGRRPVGPEGARTGPFDLPLDGLRFPPRDLEAALPQQLLLLKAAHEAVGSLEDLPTHTTGVFVALEPDVEVCRYGLRWRQRQRLRDHGVDPSEHQAALDEALDRIVPSLDAAGVVGTMPNIPANRLNSQFDARGASLTISAGEASGLTALTLAHRALSEGELDLALVGAVDLSCQPIHTRALTRLEGESTPPGDAAIVLALKRRADAERDGDAIVAVVREATDPDVRSVASLDERFGRSWAAGGLRDLAATALTLPHPPHDDATEPGRSTIAVGSRDRFTVSPGDARKGPPRGLRWHRFAAPDRGALLEALEDGRENGSGPCRLVLWTEDDEQLAARKIAARRHVLEGAPAGPGVYFRSRPIGGELAFVFAGAGAAYGDMGSPLLRALPELREELESRYPLAAAALAEPWHDDEPVSPLQRLWSSSALSQIHASLSQTTLGLRPDAVLGYSSGESNALFATGTWTDLDAMIREARASSLFTEEIGGRMTAVGRAWSQREVRWETWTVLAPVDDVRASVDAEEHVHLSIVHGDTECIIAGDADGCARIREALGRSRCLRLHYDLAVHVPELNEVRSSWLELHRRAVTTPNGVRVYSSGHGAAYRPSESACAEAILSQTAGMLDFRRVIESAWADGVRTFVEHGPQASCSRWIRDILGERDSVVVSLDRKGAGLEPIYEAVAALLAARVELDPSALTGLTVEAPPAPRPHLRFAAHPPPVELPPVPHDDRRDEPTPQAMPPAPKLRPVLSEPAVLAAAGAPSLAGPFESSDVPPSPAPNNGTTHAPATPRRESRDGAPPPNGDASDAVATASVARSRPPTATPVLAALRRQITDLAAAERSHVDQQAALHRRFLELQTRAFQALAARRGSRPTPTDPATPRPPLAEAPAAAPTSSALGISPPAPAGARAPVGTPPAAAWAPVETPPPAETPTPVETSSPVRPTRPSGPTFDRRQLEIHSSGRISDIFGSRFEVQDGFRRQVRMPEPPLLLADRITGIDADPGSMGSGTIWSETDVTPDAWYLHQGRMPSGIMIEAGQADLMLISYLGVDFTNRNDRVYRLLGCELTFHGGLPRAGETLTYDIHMDGHATQGDVRLMFFHYDCRIDGKVRLSVRQGQAGFFTDEELAQSEGCLWTPEDSDPVEPPRLDPPAVTCGKTAFSLEDVVDFSEGRPWDCFGPGFERTRTHTRTPRIQNGRMMLLGPVDELDPRGGPWGRGYVRSTVNVRPDTWFFDGHFKNDPCMPGTLMLEASLQLMAFYTTALGYTISRDGWRFEPVSERPFELSCRGQVTPSSERLVYELFVEQVQAGPIPTVVADLLCTVDGLKAFHARRLALQLVPDWPLDDEGRSLPEPTETAQIAREGSFLFDHRSLLACANGRPSEAFGPAYARFDGPTSVARLPSPPYHFISRVTRTSGAFGSMATGTEVEVEYDVSPDAWYFDENGCRVMPFAVLLEAVLQPCGWLASYLGCALSTDTELRFRNLDGRGTWYEDVLPDAGTLRTRVRCTDISKTASMIIVSFDVESSLGEVRVCDLKTVFGFFPQSALDHQVGLPPDTAQAAIFEAPPAEEVELTPTPGRERAPEGPRLAEPMLRMLDRISYFDPTGGTSGLGCARGVKQVDPGEWFFKAHFFQDPVQPGSLGIEAMLQLLQWTMREKGLAEGIEAPRFEALGLGEELTWKYRGQVVPENERLVTTLELTEIRAEAGGTVATADASLWVDGKRIYEARGLSMRIVSGGAPPVPTFTVDPAEDTWLTDHCPTWTVPALPMMSMVDLMARGASTADPVVAVLDMKVAGWLTFPGPRSLRVLRDGERVRLVSVDADGGESQVASARIQTGSYGRRPEPWPALDGDGAPLPYSTGELFHGPAFQAIESWVRTSAGASSVLRADTTVPYGRLNPGLLDAATHGIPHDRLHRWDERLSPDKVAYPAYLPEMRFFGPTPLQGELRCEVRPDGYLASTDYPAFRGQLIGEHGVWCQFRLVEACFDKGAIGSAPPHDRRAFLRDRVFVPGLRTSTQLEGITRLTTEQVVRIDWMPGTLQETYGTRDVAEIAVREHIAAAHSIHPGRLPACLPLHRFDLEIETEGETVSVRGDGRGRQDLTPVTEFWSRWFDRPPWLGEDLYYGLIERFVDRVVLDDPTAFAEVRGASLVYLGNHQVGIESLLFSILSSALSQVPTITLAKAEHRSSWLGELIAHGFSYPGIEDPGLIRFFERTDASALPGIVEQLVRDMSDGQRSVMVHVEGTRSLDCTTPVRQMSGAFVDLAIAARAPLVPVRFVGGLPRERLEQRLEFPVGMGRQDVYIGRPIEPGELAELPYGARRSRLLDAINALGPSPGTERPRGGDDEFAARVAAWQAEHGVREEHAVLGCVLAERRDPTEETRRFLAGETPAAGADDPVARWLAQLARHVFGRSRAR